MKNCTTFENLVLTTGSNSPTYIYCFMQHFYTRLFLALVILITTGKTVSGQVQASFTSSITSGCAPLNNVSFTSTSTGNPTSFLWRFGNGNTSTQNPASASYATPGTYTVTLIVSNSSSTDSVVAVNYITVFENPAASFTISPDSVCEGHPVTFTSTSTPGDAPITRYGWTFNDGSPTDTSGSQVSHIYQTPSPVAYTPVLIITDGNGCQASVNGSIYVFQNPVAMFTPSQSSSCTAPLTVTFNNSSTGIPSYNWNFGDPSSGANNTSTGVTPTHTFNAPGDYTVTLTAGVPDCDSTYSVIISIRQANADFSAEDTVCLFAPVTLTNTSAPSSANWQWNFDDPASGTANTSTLASPVHYFSTPGMHQVSLNMTVNGTCTDNVTHPVYVRQQPVANFGAPSFSGCSVPFTVNLHDSTTGAAAWHWNFGDPGSGSQDSSSLQHPTHTYTAFGYYYLQLYVTDIFGCTDTAIHPLNLEQPQANFTQQDSGCIPLNITFTNTSVSNADPIASYSWNFGDPGSGSNTSSSQNPGHTYNTTGVFDVTLIITTQTGCRDTTTYPGFIRAGRTPTANFSFTPNTLCYQDPVQFTDLSTPADSITGWQWSFGDGGGAQTQNPEHPYVDTAIADPFDVQLIVYYYGCPDTMVQSDIITVNPPIPHFQPAFDCNNPFNVVFNNTTVTAGTTLYTWNFGDGSPNDTSGNPAHTYAVRGTYNVTLTAENTTYGCTRDTTYYNIQITDPVVSLLSDTTQGCFPLTVHFTGSGSQDASLYEWHFGEGIPNVLDTSRAADTLHTYNRPGFYTAQLMIQDVHGCRDSSTKVIHVLGPTAGFIATPFSGCAPLNVSFTDTSNTEGSNLVQWVWNYGPGQGPSDTTSTGTTSHNYLLPGNYTIILTVTDGNGCSGASTQVNYIQPTLPQPVFVNLDSFVCPGSPVIITANPGQYVANPVSYHWYYGDGQDSISTSNTTSHTYSVNGTDTLRLVVTDGNGCTGSTQAIISVLQPVANFTVTQQDTCIQPPGSQVYVAQSIALIEDHSSGLNPSGGNHWYWNVGTGVPVNDASSITYYYFTPGTYDVSLIVENSAGCRDTLLMNGAVVVPGPVGSFTFVPDNGCRPLGVTFNGTSNSTTSLYTWDFGDGSVISGTSQDTIQHTYTDAGVFTPFFYLGFQLSNGQTCYSRTGSPGTVTVTQLLGVDIVEDTLFITEGDRDTLHTIPMDPTNNPPYTYTWTPASHISNDPLSSTTFYVQGEGSSGYYYVLMTDQNGCGGYDSVMVIIRSCEDTIHIPNVFTPNHDGKNDNYLIKGLCPYKDFRIIIFNRWGKKMFESNNPGFVWDGKTEGGTDASEGVYYYVINSKNGELRGYIDLIRK